MTDSISVEEPVEFRYCGSSDTKSLAITMRTPGHDLELALGFLFSEGIITKRSDVTELKRCGKNGSVVKFDFAGNIASSIEKLKRHFYTTSSCGICGKASIDAIEQQRVYPISRNFFVSKELLLSLPDRLSEVQSQFTQTGGLHASALFDIEGSLLILREDVGRHNALDKVIGWGLENGRLPYSKEILVLSGRASFELIQKAAMAGIPFVASIGAPSSLAIELATKTGITLIGFLKASGFNVYSGRVP